MYHRDAKADCHNFASLINLIKKFSKNFSHNFNFENLKIFPKELQVVRAVVIGARESGINPSSSQMFVLSLFISWYLKTYNLSNLLAH